MYVELLFYCSMVREIVIYNDRVHDFITCSSFLCYVLSSAEIHIKVYLYKILFFIVSTLQSNIHDGGMLFKV